MNRVDIRARVTGFLEAVLFQDGESVTEGAPLFRIDTGPSRREQARARSSESRAP